MENMMSEITSIEQLETIFSQPSVRAKNKVMPQIDCHAQTLIENSSFAILSTCDHLGFTDLSPKGGTPGFIKTINSSTLLIPESSGNNRVDSLRNIINNPKVGLIFMVNGIDEVLRVKGVASIHSCPELLSLCPDGNKPPKIVIKIEIKSLYFHCGKAVMRAKLWSDKYKAERSILPSLAQILKQQQNLKEEALNQDEMIKYYKSTL